MTDLWEDEGFGSAGGPQDEDGEDGWDEEDEALESTLEDGLDDPADPKDEDWDAEADE
jgi:hypothetical protein